MNESWMTAKLPEALYGCADDDCAGEVSYYPRDLKWWRGSEAYPPGFYCDEGANCLEVAMMWHYECDDARIEDDECMIGPSLEYVLAQRG